MGRDRLREFLDLILSTLDEEIDGPGIASRGCLSRYHFDRLVSSATGESPGAFRRRILLERAAWELRGSRATSTGVALRSGYRSVEGFTRAFTRAFGTTPGRFRKTGRSIHLDAPNGVHFHPPGSLSVPGPRERSERMDFVDRIVGHDLWLTQRLLDRASELPEEALDRTVDTGPVLFGDSSVSLREILNALVANKENWSATLAGGPPPSDDDTSLEGLKRRFAGAAKSFGDQVRAIKQRGDWDAGFVDALCDPPESFTYGGMLAHVATFSTVRRTRAILAFRALGVDDLGIGDPIQWERSRA